MILHCHSKTFYHLGFVQLPTSLSWTNNLQGRFKEGELILELSCGWIFIHPKLNPNFTTSLKLKVYILFFKWNASSLFGHRKTKNYMKLDLKGTCVRKRDPCEGPCTFCVHFQFGGAKTHWSELKFTLFNGCTSSMVHGCPDPNSVSHYLKVDFRWSVVFGPLYY